MPKATAVFDADDSRLGAALVRINSRMLALQARIAKFAGAFLAIRSAARFVTAGFDHLREAIDLGAHLDDLSTNTGVAAGDLAVLQREFQNAGLSAEDLEKVFPKMFKSLESDGASDTVKKLGLDLARLKAMSPAEQFRALGRAIHQLPTPAERAAMAMDLFCGLTPDAKVAADRNAV